MDPKAIKTLDPKLKEVYDRVMGTQLTPASGTPTAQKHPTQSSQPSPLVHPTIPSASSPSTPIAQSPLQTPVTQPQGPAAMPALSATPAPKPFTPPPPPPAASVIGASTNKSAIDYAALAARYAAPSAGQPSAASAGVTASNTASPAHPAVVTPSATTYGVVNTGKNTPAAAEKKEGSSLKKVLLFAGIPIFFIAYTFVWIIVFKVDLTKLL